MVHDQEMQGVMATFEKGFNGLRSTMMVVNPFAYGAVMLLYQG